MKNSQRWYLLGRTSVGFCDVDLHFVVVVVVILHLLIFFIHIFFSTSSLTLSWTIARFLKLILNFQPSPEWFTTLSFFNHSVIFLPWALRFWVGIFYPQTFFTLCSFTNILPAFIKASLGAGSSSLKFAGLHTDPWNTHPAHLFVWLKVVHNLHIQNDSFLNSTKQYQKIVCGESLVYLLLTRFELFSLVQSHM